MGGEILAGWSRIARTTRWYSQRVNRTNEELIEAGNVRHEHEFKVWRDQKFPAGKILIPGVVSHAIDLI